VFLLDGEQVLGLKQNRTFNLSMLLKPQSRTVVPVTCLEAGRWSRSTANVQAADHVHFSSGRANKLRSVSESVRRDGTYVSDQRTVWGDITRILGSLHEPSPTRAEADYYSRRKRELAAMSSPLRALPNQVGAAIGFGARLVGLDIFLTPDLYRGLHDKLLKSYLLDAFDCEEAVCAPSRDFVLRKIRDLFSAEPARAPAPGAGEALRWVTRDGSAAALVCDGQCFHAVGFCTDKTSSEDFETEVA
jgi:hypothetical protein